MQINDDQVHIRSCLTNDILIRDSNNSFYANSFGNFWAVIGNYTITTEVEQRLDTSAGLPYFIGHGSFETTPFNLSDYLGRERAIADFIKTNVRNFVNRDEFVKIEKAPTRQVLDIGDILATPLAHLMQ